MTECKGNEHIGPFRYGGDEEDIGRDYSPYYDHFVSLICQKCYKEVKRFDVYEVADLLNKKMEK